MQNIHRIYYLLLLKFLFEYEPLHENKISRFPTRSDKNQTLQPGKISCAVTAPSVSHNADCWFSDAAAIYVFICRYIQYVYVSVHFRSVDNRYGQYQVQ